MNRQVGVENVVSGKYDKGYRVYNLQAAVVEHRKQKQKKEAKDFVLRSEGSWYYSKFLGQPEQVN